MRKGNRTLGICLDGTSNEFEETVSGIYLLRIMGWHSDVYAYLEH